MTFSIIIIFWNSRIITEPLISWVIFLLDSSFLLYVWYCTGCQFEELYFSPFLYTDKNEYYFFSMYAVFFDFGPPNKSDLWPNLVTIFDIQLDLNILKLKGIREDLFDL